VIAVCWKWVAADDDVRWAGVSDADRAALEIALRLAETTGDDVTVASVGGPGADHGLREARAIGAAAAVRVDAPAGLASDAVARALAAVVAGAEWVLCGDASPDRGSGAVPAFLAAELGAAQALGLVDVTPAAGPVRATRRLDGGRREVLDIDAPAVLSLEGAAATLRRASLPGELAARTAPIRVVAGPSGPIERADTIHPYRPRPRVMGAPTGDALERVLQLTDSCTARAAHELMTLEPAAAADHILAVLADWGYVPAVTPAT
jgi:electron transfer flavoprotein beta subunit